MFDMGFCFPNNTPDEDRKKGGRGGKVFLTCSTIEHYRNPWKHKDLGEKLAYDRFYCLENQYTL